MKNSRGKKRLHAEARPIIESIAESKRRTTAFAYLTGDDIAQEVWVICLRALDDYDPTKGKLEHYLRRCVENRLKNLRRDRYFRPPVNNLDRTGETRDRINIVNALPLGGGDVGEGGSSISASSQALEPHAVLAAKELREHIEARIPRPFLSDLRRMLAGERLPNPRLEKVRDAVRKVLEDTNANA